MANGANTAPSLSFPRETFAKLTPGPFLHAHLKAPHTVRPNGRRPEEARKPQVNCGSLTHSNGSAVVRLGDTAVVCGVRAEILVASDIPHAPSDDIDDDDLIEELGILVPNLELSTGCSPAHLPGNPPGLQAQALSYRILSLLHSANLLSPKNLRIPYTEPSAGTEVPDEGPKTTVKAYWTLYIDILCIALDGNAFDAAWFAVMAALRDTVLPKAWWDPDREMILCSPLAVDCYRLQLNALPIASTFAVCSTASPLKKSDQTVTWILSDPDGFEEDVCKETLTIVTAGTKGGAGVLMVEKGGGSQIGRSLFAECAQLAMKKSLEWEAALHAW
jgi:exosome complex component RRP43